MSTTINQFMNSYEGTGAGGRYGTDNKIGKLELARGGLGYGTPEDLAISRALRHGVGDGDGFLDANEFQTLLDGKIIEFDDNGKIKLTTNGEDVLDNFINRYDTDGNSVISRDEFIQGNPPTSSDFVGRVYDNVLDADKNGEVTLEEYIDFSNNTNEYDRVFGAYDTEGADGEPGADGFWNAKEFAQAYDVDGDGIVTEDQIAVAETLIKGGLDLDDDGLVSEEEYMTFQNK